MRGVLADSWWFRPWDGWRRALLLVPIVLLGWSSAACGGGGGEQTTGGGTVIRIAVQSPLTGARVDSRDALATGAALAVQLCSGPLAKMGFKVELATYDDEGVASIGVVNAEQIVADGTVLGVIGHGSSSVGIPASEVYHNDGLANISPASTSPELTTRGYEEVSRVVGRDDVQGAVGARFAYGRGARSAWIIHERDVYGRGLAASFRREAQTLGLKVKGSVAADEVAYLAALAEPVAAADPDVLYYGGFYEQGAALFKAARDAGFTGMCLAGDGFNFASAATIGGPALLEGAGTYFTTVAAPARAYPGAAGFIADYEAKFGKEPAQFAAQAYDATAVLLRAIEDAARAAGGAVPTRAAVVAAVRSLGLFDGITTDVRFNDRGDLEKAPYFVFKVVSSDPAQWNENELVDRLRLAPPTSAADTSASSAQ